MKSKPADKIQDLQFFGEFGGVNPSVSDSSTYTFLSAKSMSETFEGNTDGCYLYSRNSSPSNLYLEEAKRAIKTTFDKGTTREFRKDLAREKKAGGGHLGPGRDL